MFIIKADNNIVHIFVKNDLEGLWKHKKHTNIRQLTGSL